MARLSYVVWLLALTACMGNVIDATQREDGPSLDAGGQLLPDDGSTWHPDGGWLLPHPDGGLPGALTGGDAAGPGGAADGGLDATVSWSNLCNGVEPVVGDLRIRELSIYQVVKIPLFKDDSWVMPRNASVVQGKKALLRAFIEPLTDYRPRLLRAVLSIDNDGRTTQLTSEKTLGGASTDEAPDSTFDFNIDGALIGPSTQLSVAILERSCPAPGSASAGARVPATGLQALGSTRFGTLRVVLVPVDIGGRVPDTGAEQVARIHDELLAYYPVAEVEVTTHAPLSWSQSVLADSTGWTELLNEIGLQRERDAPARDVYYFGLVTPAPSFREYCGVGCVLGLAPQTRFVSPPDQIGLGLGFINAGTYKTIVHELGHAHGRGHAPCAPDGASIQGVDARYPYMGGEIGSWGWDSRSGQLLSPTRYTDVMGYCNPAWISDFNYEALATRSRNVNTAARILTTSARPTTWQRVILFADGRARWAGVSTTDAPTDRRAAYAVGAQGQELGEVEVAYVPLSHSPDAFLYVPEPDPAWASLQLGGRALVFADIEPAR
jgi:hypothetical protein